MENSKKSELIEFLNYVPENNLIGIYYTDKSLKIVHYTIYKYDELEILMDKLVVFDNNLENDFVKIITWQCSDSEDYLIGVYDGIVKTNEDSE